MSKQPTKTKNRLWVLGAPDPEMAAIERLLIDCGERVAYALLGGERVRPGTAYRGTAVRYVTDCGEAGETVYLVECAVPVPHAAPVVIDHHREGDPGHGRPPSEFCAASSLGQVISHLARLDALPWDRCAFGGLAMTSAGVGCAPGTISMHRSSESYWVSVGEADDPYGTRDWARIPDELVLAAAADHCVGAAYRGECPGVDPDHLMRWRAESRAAFQGRSVEEVLADIARAREAIVEAGRLTLGDGIELADMRRPDPIAELPEAAMRMGVGYVSGPLIGPDGRHKYTCSGHPEQVRAFLEHWAPAEGLIDCYGDPMRGFAGGYLCIL